MLVFRIVFLCLIAFAAGLNFIKNMHFFQLNSYKAGTQFPWLKNNFGKLIPNFLILILGVLSLIGNVALYVAAAVGALIMLLANLPKKAKKPLKYTTRVIRMIVTSSVIYFAVIAVAFAFNDGLFFAVASVLTAMIPLILMLSNLINAPLEASVRAWYTNDAKKMLRACPDMTTIGVTGSYGKTSVKFFLATLLKAKYNTLVTPENYNTPMGVVKTVRSSLRSTHEMFVCEMGAKYKGDIKELCRLVHPKFGVVTSIGEQHLETFGSLETIIKTKFEIYHELPNDGILFVNGDNEVINANLPIGGVRVIKYGTSDGCDYIGKDISVSRRGTEFIVVMPNGEECVYSTKLIGAHNVVNLTGAIAVAVEMGISPKELVPYVKKINPVEHRLQLIEKGNLTVIDDAYNSNPAGCRAALETLALFDDMKILVTPGMVELGELQESCNMEFGRQAARVCDYVVLVGEKQTQPIKAGLDSEGYPEEKVFIASGIQEALSHVYALQSEKRKMILLENDLPDTY